MANYYDVLGVNKNADQDTIKRAYRGLASKHHPDKGGNTEKFQEIQKAYDVIGDPERRREYDHQLNNPLGGNTFHFNTDSSDAFEQFKNIFGFDSSNFFRKNTDYPRKNRSLRITVELELEDVLTQQSKIVQISQANGTSKTVRIDIPAGVQNQQSFKYSGLGDRSNPALPPGDLFVEIRIRPNDKFQIVNYDLLTSVEIDCLDALTGAEVIVTTLDKKELKFNIAPGTNPGTKYKLKAQGLLIPNSNIRGDLIVIVNLTVKKLDSRFLELINQLKIQINENKP